MKIRLLLISLITLLSFGLVGCPEDNPSEPNVPVSEDETIVEEKTSTINSSGGKISLSDGTEIIISEGALDGDTEITLSKIENDNYFSGENRVSLNINSENNISEMTIKIKVIPGLQNENIGLFRFNPADAEMSFNIEGDIPDFEYDSETGLITATVSAATSKSKKEKIQGSLLYPRWIAEWDENIEPEKESKIIQIPFYEQPGSSCWATCAVMLSKSYTPYKDRTYEREVYHYLQYLGLGKDEGIMSYQFLKTLPKAFHLYSGGAGVETTGYFRLSTLRERLIKEIDNNKPVIISLDYPGVGQHAILVIGYNKITSGSNKVTYELVIHNPQGTGSETMYTTHDFDYIFQKKSFTTAVQILHSSNVVHPDRTLLTVGVPLKGLVGHIRFVVPFKKTSKYNIDFTEDITTSKGYQFTWNEKKMLFIPDTASVLDLRLPIWNSDRNSSKSAKLELKVYRDGKTAYEFEESINIPISTSAYWFTKTIPLDDIRQEFDSSEYYFRFKLFDGSNYADGFDFFVNLNNSLKPVIESITPPNKYPEEIVTIHGMNFGFPQPADWKITFNGTEVYSYYDWTDTLIMCTIPKYATSGDVVVTANGKSSKPFFYQVGADDEITINLEHEGIGPYNGNLWIEQGVKSIDWTVNISNVISGQIKGTNLKQLEKNDLGYNPQWSFDVLAPGKVSYDLEMIVNVVVETNDYNWEDDYNGLACRFEGTFYISHVDQYKIEEYYNDRQQYDDLLKYLPYSSQSAKTGDNSAEFHFSMDIPVMQEINDIVNEHSINPFAKRFFGNMYLDIGYTFDLNIYDAVEDTLVKHILKERCTSQEFGCQIGCNFKESM